MASKVPASSTRKPGQRVDVEEAPIVDFAGGKPPVRRACSAGAPADDAAPASAPGASGAGAIGGEPALDDLARRRRCAASSRLEGRALRRASGWCGPRVARRRARASARRPRSSSAPASVTIVAQDLAVAFRRDRQPMLEIPGGKAAFGGIVAKLDLAALQRLAVGRAEDRQQHAAAGAIGQHAPSRCRRRPRAARPGPHSSTSSHQALSAKCTPTWLGTKSRIRPMSCCFSAALSRAKPASPPSSGLSCVVIDDVVAVGAARARLHERRGVEMADAERLQIGHDRRGVVEVEIRR